MTAPKRALLAGTALAGGALAMSAAATWTAGQFGHHPLLGGTEVLGLHLYPPGKVFTWFPLFGGALWDLPGAFLQGVLLSGAAGVLSALFALKSMVLGFGRGEQEPFGADHWGKLGDAVEAGFIMGKGRAPKESSQILFAGRFDRHLLTVTDGRHMMVYGPSGAGKTRGIVAPSLLAWGASALVYAAGKADVIDMTSGWRATFSDVRVFDLGDPQGWRFNPLSEIRIGTAHEISDAMLVAQQFPPKAAAESTDPFWDIEGTRLLSAVILHVLYTAPVDKRHLGTARRLLHHGARTLADALRASPHHYVRECATSLLEREERSRDSILGTAASYLGPWASPIVEEVTDRSDFRLSDLVAGDKPMTLYLRLPSDKREVWRPVLKVIIAQFTRAMMADEHHMPDGRSKRHKLLLALDEFHSFGIGGFGADMAEMRSYGVQCLLATQSPRSLEGTYGRHQTITENCRVQVFMASGDPQTLRAVSDMIGPATELRAARSRSRPIGQLLGGQHSTSEMEQVRAVLDTGKVRAFDNDRMIVLPTGHKPFQVEKMLDFDRHPPFRDRVLPTATRRPGRALIAGPGPEVGGIGLKRALSTLQ
ncbi:MAG: hypothetical protein EA406_13335 [Rhodospirillales bacterium]|nr:MAG: hypothetical protein EA406_13335 [Rhodospirillales bacterium]